MGPSTQRHSHPKEETSIGAGGAVWLYGAVKDVDQGWCGRHRQKWCVSGGWTEKFIAILPSKGFTPDVKVWEVCFNKTGDFKEVKRAFELKGHTSGVFCFAFSNDSSRMASVSRDGTWKLWDCNSEYNRRYFLVFFLFPPHQCFISGDALRKHYRMGI
ncbi:hypothetical protein HPB51_021270 [Rhipicephalus microplus]|uniref:Uncharacterized protein n=1 Tax=Rhipicephalus microplus TaxID=6941 RepID=A0A9J6F5V8_RHIMP|nr:hypothetical protein HPB51_021270 [Rhipicephalus microplus]